jgi:hypothetical protein
MMLEGLVVMLVLANAAAQHGPIRTEHVETIRDVYRQAHEEAKAKVDTKSQALEESKQVRPNVRTPLWRPDESHPILQVFVKSKSDFSTRMDTFIHGLAVLHCAMLLALYAVTTYGNNPANAADGKKYVSDKVANGMQAVVFTAVINVVFMMMDSMMSFPPHEKDDKLPALEGVFSPGELNRFELMYDQAKDYLRQRRYLETFTMD